MSRSLVTLITLTVIGLLLLPADSNIAADAIPDTWRPYLWLGWPLSVIRAAPMIYGEIRARHQPFRHYPATVDEQQHRLGRAAHDLAEAVRSQWSHEAGLRSLRNPEPINVRWTSVDRPVAPDLWRV